MLSIVMNKEKSFSLLLAILVLSLPIFVAKQYYIIVLNLIGLDTIIVVGLSLLIGYAGQISLGHAAFFGMGAYLSAILSTTIGLSTWFSTILAMALTAALAYLVGYPMLKLKGHYLVMATLGFNIIVNICMIELTDITGGPSGFSGIPHFSIGSFQFDTDVKNFYLIWVTALLSIFVSLNLVRSRIGRALRTIHTNEIAASALGIDSNLYKTKVFVFSATLASLAGCLYSHYLTFISPRTFDLYCSIRVATMVILGGFGSIWGSLLGAALLTVLTEFLQAAEKYSIIAYGLILTAVLGFIPEGILPSLKISNHKNWQKEPINENSYSKGSTLKGNNI